MGALCISGWVIGNEAIIKCNLLPLVSRLHSILSIPIGKLVPALFDSLYVRCIKAAGVNALSTQILVSLGSCCNTTHISGYHDSLKNYKQPNLSGRYPNVLYHFARCISYTMPTTCSNKVSD